jgi:filamentous hemagglutinin family protein
MMKPTWGKYWAITASIIAMSPALLTAPVTAQPITAAQDGTNTVVLPNGQQFDITGGTQAGANLFHSFQQFGLSQGQIANFLSQPNIQNILGRVVGGDPSVINGLIQLTGGNSNLYIMNPAGVIFGTNASLNVPASFTATTANGIQVGNSWFGMNTIASDLKNLTGTRNAFAFTSPSTTIQNQTSGVIVNQGNLNVSEGKSITLVGGIVINTGTIESPNGNINIVAVPDGKYVRITTEGGVLSFDLPIATQQELGSTTPIAGIDLPKLLAGSGIVAPTKAGEAAISGNLTAANINVLANRYDTTQASLNAANIQQGWNFVFIDSTVKDYQTLLNGTNGGSSVTVINPDQYGIAQVTATLASVTGANSLHIVSEGDVGNFWLGKDFVSTENIAKYANDLQAWKTSLSPAANILLYACNLASGENGAALVQAVKHYTGREVAASTDLTGSSKLGGNWNLEYQTGKLNTGVVFSNDAQNSYNGRLATFTATNITANSDQTRYKSNKLKLLSMKDYIWQRIH